MKGRTANDQFAKQLEHLVDTLRGEIVGGAYAVGDQLPNEKQLASRFQLGNNSIRKGLDVLVEEGLIRKIPRVGNRVICTHTRKVTIKLACPQSMWRNTDLSRLLDDFRSLYPWISVKALEDGGSSLSQEADVIVLAERQFRKIAEEGKAVLLKPLQRRDDLYPIPMQSFEYGDELFMYPVIFSPIVLLYNRAHFRECRLAVPDGGWTWDDLIRCGERLSETKGRYGFCFHVPDINRWPVFLIQSGETFRRDGTDRIELKGSAILESFRLLKRILANRELFPVYYSDGNQDISKAFQEGKISMTLSSYMGLNEMRQAKVEYDIAPLPFFREPRTLMISLGAGIRSDTNFPDEANMLLEYFLSERAQNLIRSYTTSIPSLRTLPEQWPDRFIRRPMRYGLYREIVHAYRTHESLNLACGDFPKLFRELKQYLADMTDEDALCEGISSALSSE